MALIFVRRGEAMKFKLPPCPERSAVAQLIQSGGGILLKDGDADDDVIHLVPRGAGASRPESVAVQFIFTSTVKKSRLKISDFNLRPLTSQKDDSSRKDSSAALIGGETRADRRKKKPTVKSGETGIAGEMNKSTEVATDAETDNQADVDESRDGKIDGEADNKADGDIDGEADNKADGDINGEADNKADGDIDDKDDGRIDGKKVDDKTPPSKRRLSFEDGMEEETLMVDVVNFTQTQKPGTTLPAAASPDDDDDKSNDDQRHSDDEDGDQRRTKEGGQRLSSDESQTFYSIVVNDPTEGIALAATEGVREASMAMTREGDQAAASAGSDGGNKHNNDNNKNNNSDDETKRLGGLHGSNESSVFISNRVLSASSSEAAGENDINDVSTDSLRQLFRRRSGAGSSTPKAADAAAPGKDAAGVKQAETVEEVIEELCAFYAVTPEVAKLALRDARYSVRDAICRIVAGKAAGTIADCHRRQNGRQNGLDSLVVP